MGASCCHLKGTLHIFLSAHFREIIIEAVNAVEARDYFANETLKARLIEISEAIYNLNGDIEYILDFPDNMKFKSCMTLFYLIAPEYKIFKNNLDRYFDGELCSHTLKIFNDENK